MQKIVFCTVGVSPALTYAKNQLTFWGYKLSDNINASVTHILLPIPSLDENMNIRGGPNLTKLLKEVPEHATILGGNLPDINIKTIDFLRDEYYLAENASITAHCALTLATQKMERTLNETKILVIGWGRIGKCLAEMTRSLGANITVATRNISDQAILNALGYHAIGIDDLRPNAYKLIINTVPAQILDSNHIANDIVLIDLASTRGITGDHVIWARGLPGKMAPESSGILIAKTALRYALGKE